MPALQTTLMLVAMCNAEKQKQKKKKKKKKPQSIHIIQITHIAGVYGNMFCRIRQSKKKKKKKRNTDKNHCMTFTICVTDPSAMRSYNKKMQGII